MAKKFVEDENLVTLANQTIEENKMDWLNSINIKYLVVEPEISKTTVARCIKPSKELAYFGKFDYLVEVSKRIWDSINDETRKIVLFHELSHILIVNDDDSGTTKYLLAQHDVMDFAKIINKYGINWLTEVKTINASIYELDPTKNKIKM